jgi:aspartyl-tRNA(Asn)/glutamyl-tRNA(Gln) amidotransferase subunit C
MSLDTDTVRRIANLARIKIEDSKLLPLADELSHIIDWIEQLSEVDTNAVAPMTSMTKVDMPSRSDVISDGNCEDLVLTNARDSVPPYFAVPKVVE